MEVYDEEQGKYIDVPSTRPDSWVPALPERRRHTPTAYPIEQHTALAHSDGRALEALASVVETATPLQRAGGLVVRTSVPVLLITGLLLLAAFLLGGDEQWAAAILILGAILIGGFWFVTDRLERRDSAAGIEHHKIDEAATLAEMREANQHERATKLLDSYIRSLERDK